MKQLILVRHAKSSWDDPSLADHDRPLNKRGKRDAPFMAQLLESSGLIVDGMVSSTAKRARKTAQAFAEAFRMEKAEVKLTKDLYHASYAEITRVVQQLPNDWDCVLLFGHNPGFTYLANRFEGGYLENVPTCGIVGSRAAVRDWQDWEPTAAERHLYFYPKQFFL